MMQLFDSSISPFARKVRLVLEHKRLNFEAIDGLLKSNHDQLQSVNHRIEVPALIDDGLVIVNSSDIVRYLEDRYPQRPVYPDTPARRARVRAWERCADTFLDPVLINISYWKWAQRDDRMPSGLLAAACSDLEMVFERLDRDLHESELIADELSIADFALFPHFTGLKALTVPLPAARFANVERWFSTMQKLPVCRNDVIRARRYFSQIGTGDFETSRIFWRGDRIEWLLAQGFHDWFFNEIINNRVSWPGPSLPPLTHAS